MNKKQLINELRQEEFSEKIIRAFEKVKRVDFVDKEMRGYAYENKPLPIGKNATISQPYTIAFMLELLELKEDLKILEIGSGSGYVLALINEICNNCDILGIEINKELVNSSKNILKREKNIKIICENGNKQRNEKFDRILVSASAKEIPDYLNDILNEQGIVVIPVRNSIFKLKKVDGKIIKKEYPGFVFVPLVG